MKRSLPTMLTSSITQQELFDYITHFLYKQGSPCIADLGAIGVEDFTCAYRGPNGAMCAVGCVIPDGFYKPSMEGEDVYSLVDKFGRTKGQKKYWKMISSNKNLLDDLQQIHDSLDAGGGPTSNRCRMLSGFRKIARNFELQFDLADYKLT